MAVPLETTMKLAIVPLLFAASLAFAGEPSLNDAQIAHIAYTAGQLDIDAAQVALKKDLSPEVRAFAETMLRDHIAVNERALALVGKLGVTPQENATSQSLAAAAAETLKVQQALPNEAFEKAYVANEVAYHAQVNAALRTALIPGASNPELKSLLEDGLALFSEHQKHAEVLDAALK